MIAKPRRTSCVGRSTTGRRLWEGLRLNDAVRRFGEQGEAEGERGAFASCCRRKSTEANRAATQNHVPGSQPGGLRADEEQPWARLGQESTRVDGKRVDRVAEAVERFNRGYQIIAAVRGCKPGEVLKNRDLRAAVLQFFKQTDEMPERSRLVAC